MNGVTFTGLLLGVALGMRHALEPDHLAAVSTLVLESGSSRRGMVLGAFWGVGHSFSLLVVGCLLALLHAQLPVWLGELFELAVALMLLGLGARALWTARRAHHTHAEGQHHTQWYGDSTPHHTHPYGHTHGHHTHAYGHARRASGRSLASRPLAFGIVHGLAGSGALTALVVAELPSTASRVAYIALFGLGSIVGMATLSGLAGWPLARLGRRRTVGAAITALTGSLSFGLGMTLLWPFATRALSAIAS